MAYREKHTTQKHKLYKVIMLGDPGVGKTSLYKRFTKNIFADTYKSTIGADFTTITISHNIILQIWDTAGQERFNSLGVSFYRGTDSVVLVFDLSDFHTFDRLETWLDEFLINSCPPDVDNYPIIVIGNKSDSEKKISRTRIDRFCKSRNNMHYFETSAKQNVNVQEAFNKIGELLEHVDGALQFSFDNIVDLKKQKTKSSFFRRLLCC